MSRPGLRRLSRWVSAAPLLVVSVLVASAAEPPRPVPLKSGLEFAGADVRAMQADDFDNPGMLWVARGETVWREPAGTAGKSCASCHQEAPATMKGVAARYPAIDRGGTGLVNLEGRINACRVRHQGAGPLAYETEPLLALTAYVAHQSRGMPVNVVIDAHTRAHFERGREFYYGRVGQINLSCAHCHQANWGKQLGPETLSQGHGTAFPGYRLEWQTVGSLHRRFRSCLSGVRAAMLPAGSPEYFDLELFLAWRANGLPLETPGVRR